MLADLWEMNQKRIQNSEGQNIYCNKLFQFRTDTVVQGMWKRTQNEEIQEMGDQSDVEGEVQEDSQISIQHNGTKWQVRYGYVNVQIFLSQKWWDVKKDVKDEEKMDPSTLKPLLAFCCLNSNVCLINMVNILLFIEKKK